MSLLTAFRPAEIERPVLELDGESIRAALRIMIAGADDQGGIERYVDAVKLKSTMFQQALADDVLDELDVETFKGLCAFMATVRRRVGKWLTATEFVELRQWIKNLLADEGTIDARIEAFCSRFPRDKEHRWVRDLATELLHNRDPERVPLMNRWIWDATANTGVLREIWHGDDVDHIKIPVGDGYATYLMLREELSQFLSNEGFFRDVLQYADILCAQVYAQYICEQGGSYLRTDFSAPEDPMQHTRRLLGLDGVQAGNGKTRLKSIDGEAFVLDDSDMPSEAEH